MDNPKYRANKKNGGVIPRCSDVRMMRVAVGCQVCIECRKMKARNWQQRLIEDIKGNVNGKFITLTFSTEGLNKVLSMIKEKVDEDSGEVIELSGYALDNAIATRAVRLFLERWRKEFGKSLRHWLVTELGGGHSEHIHLHGIVWCDNVQEIESFWKYGNVWVGYEGVKNYVSARTVNYIVKYINKMDEVHLNYVPVILTSNGIGRDYIDSGRSRVNAYKDKKCDERYRLDNGFKSGLSIYFRNKVYSEEQREKLWVQKLDEEVRYVCGEKIDFKRGDKKKKEREYYELLEYHRKRQEELGFKSPAFIWSKKKYEEERRALIHSRRLNT